MIFKHTAREPGMWRGWIKNDDSLEITWPRTPIGIRYALTDSEGRGSHRQMWIGLGLVQAFIPMGSSDQEFPAMEGPQWGFQLSREFGIVLHWGQRRKSWDWPWDWHTLAYETQLPDGSWVDVLGRFNGGEEFEPHKEVYPYTYVLHSREAQERTATVSKCRHVICYRGLKAIRWPQWIKESIDVEFDDEVGEGTGSWKGGTIGCGYDIQPGETFEQTLRRMERERKFT